MMLACLRLSPFPVRIVVAGAYRMLTALRCERGLKGIKRIAISFAAIALFATAGGVPAQEASTSLAHAGPGVPFEFSHKNHAETKMQCVFCHEESQTGAKATFPREQKCMVCHASVKADSDAIKQLAAIPKDSRIVPEKPLFKLAEFVYFSHAKHAAAKIECTQCHGDVFSMDVVELHMPMRMKACVDCHKASGAPATCTSCHEEIQQ